MHRRPRTLLVLAALPLSACGSSDGGPSGGLDAGDFSRPALLEHLGRNVLAPIHDDFAVEAGELVTALEAHCDALATGDGQLAAAQEAWGEAMDAWQRAEAVLVGPAAMNDKALRDRIYAWPLAATCGVDQDVLESWNQPDAYDVASQLNNVRSLAAVEYLLFADSPDHTCAQDLPGWDALGDDLPRARCQLSLAIAGDVALHADELAAAWDPERGDYSRELAAAGTSGSAIPSERAAVNLVSDGFFYVDRMVKDMKLAESAGLSLNVCGTVEEPCLLEVEHRHADRATAAIRANLRALREAFTGTTPAADGPGFDDYLRAAGAPELADRMVANLDAAIEAADALPDSFLTALADDREAVVAAHARVKAFTDDLKSQFLTVLALERPDSVEADND